MTNKLDKIPQSVEGKIKYALALKDEGNVFFKAQNFKKALWKYKMIFMYITGIENNITDIVKKNASPEGNSGKKVAKTEEEKKIKEIMHKTQLNISLCYFNLKKGRRCREFANKVIKEDADNMKAYFRRGQGYFIDGFVDEAKGDFKKVLEKNPDDVSAKRMLKMLIKRKKELLKKEKKIGAKMLDGLDG